MKDLKFMEREIPKNIIVSWGSPTGAILDAIGELDVGFLEILYLEPFPGNKKRN